MKYRIATLKDAEKIADLHAHSWRESYRGIFSDSFLDKDVWDDRKACWLKRLVEPKYNQHVVVVTDNDVICGFVCAFGNEDPNWGTFIDNLHISSPYKGKGIGKSLMRMVAKWSMDSFPDEGLYLEVLEDNTAARGFYDSLGATHQETRLWQPPGSNHKVNDLLYVWKSIKCMGLKVG